MFLCGKAWKCVVFKFLEGSLTWWTEGVGISQVIKMSEFWKYYRILAQILSKGEDWILFLQDSHKRRKVINLQWNLESESEMEERKLWQEKLGAFLLGSLLKISSSLNLEFKWNALLFFLLCVFVRIILPLPL